MSRIWKTVGDPDPRARHLEIPPRPGKPIRLDALILDLSAEWKAKAQIRAFLIDAGPPRPPRKPRPRLARS
jgi:hypothetical protein